MQNKNLLIFVVLLFTSFANAQVITSKKEAVKRGIYEKPAEKTVAAAVKTPSVKMPVKPKSGISGKSVKNKKGIITENGGDDLILENTDNYVALQMINNAMQFIGVSYRGGGTSKAGMDCSGMVTAVFNIFEMKLPRSSHEMAKVGEKVKKEEIKKGDLVFFRTNGRDTINHVGLVIEADSEEIKFIHSSTQKGVIISSTREPYYQKTFAQANRVIM
ncbi:MAG TPA: C40 family peptidase [Flavobacterium sp.]|jgi:cell wall-associated NlpC family hydrolase